MNKIKIYGLCSLLIISVNLQAQSTEKVDQQTADEWGDEWSDEWGVSDSPWSQTGFVELGLGEKYNSDPLFSEQSSLRELRWHQAFDYADESFDFNLDFDLWLDDVGQNDGYEMAFDLRELNFKFSLFGQTDVVLGRQISTWGTGDLLFINDMFPKDWQSFFSGRDDNYLKAPADAMRITSYFSAFNVDLVLTPSAEPDRFINGERFSLFSPLAQSQVGGYEVINPRNPNRAEYALRLFKNYQGHQMALYGYHGIEKSPTGVDSTQQAYFPHKNVWGASFQSALGQGLYHIELGYHLALDDRQGDQPTVPNSQWRLLLGYERELIKKLNWGVQYYLEHTLDHDVLLDQSLFPATEPDQNRHVITNRFTYLTKQDKLTWSVFVFYSPSDEDSYWRPSVDYRHNDQWNFTLGGQIFTGPKAHTFFAQFEEGSNIYSRIRYQF